MRFLGRTGLMTMALVGGLLHGVVAQRQRITVSSNVGVELVNALQVQISPEFLPDSAADPALFRTTRLMRLSYNYFAPFRNHAAVQRTRWLTEKIGTGVYLLPLFYTDSPQPRRVTPVSAPILAAIHSHPDSAARIADNYMELVGQFGRDANFAQFRRRYRYVYELALAETRRNLPAAAFIATLEQYYGASKAGYRIIVNPFFKAEWGMSWQVATPAGPVAYQIAAPMQEQVVQQGHVVQAGFDNAAAVRNLSVHEFGHSFVNPLTGQPAIAARLAAQAALFRPVPGQGQYRDWETLFNEHLVRAGEIRVALALGQQAVAEQLRTEYAAWMYLPFFEQQLQRYEANRQQYPSLEAFLPDLLTAVDALPR